MQGHPGAPAMTVCLPCSTARLSVTSSLPSSPLLSAQPLLLLRALYPTSAEKEGAGGQARGHFRVMGFIWVLDSGMDIWVHTCGSLTALPSISLSSECPVQGS